MCTNANVTFTSGSLSELKRLTNLICYKCLDCDVIQENPTITIYYGVVVDCVRLINVTPHQIQYGDNFRDLLNLAVAQNTPFKNISISICADYAFNSHAPIFACIELLEDKNFGVYAKNILE